MVLRLNLASCLRSNSRSTVTIRQLKENQDYPSLSFKMEVIRLLIYLENIVGIYRNYSHYSMRTKFLAIVRILLEIILLPMVSMLASYFLFLPIHSVTSSWYIIIIMEKAAVVYNSILLITSLIKAKSSEEFIKHLKCVDEILKEDANYVKAVSRGRVVFSIFTASILLLRTVVVVMRYVNVCLSSDRVSHLIKYSITNYTIHFWIDLRYFLESCIFFMYTTVLTEMLKCFAEKINVAKEKLREQRETIREEEVDGWLEMYDHLASCGRGVNSLFSFQV